MAGDVNLIDWDLIGVSVEIWELAVTFAKDPGTLKGISLSIYIKCLSMILCI